MIKQTFILNILKRWTYSKTLSCASTNYLQLWKNQLVGQYYPPKNFTEQCWAPEPQVGMTFCTSACFTIVEEIYGHSRFKRYELLTFALFSNARSSNAWLSRQIYAIWTGYGHKSFNFRSTQKNVSHNGQETHRPGAFKWWFTGKQKNLRSILQFWRFCFVPVSGISATTIKWSRQRLTNTLLFIYLLLFYLFCFLRDEIKFNTFSKINDKKSNWIM